MDTAKTEDIAPDPEIDGTSERKGANQGIIATEEIEIGMVAKSECVTGAPAVTGTPTDEVCALTF